MQDGVIREEAVSVVAEPRLVTVPEAAERISMSASWTWQRVLDGTIPSVTLGRSRRIRLEDLEAFIAARVERRGVAV